MKRTIVASLLALGSLVACSDDSTPARDARVDAQTIDGGRKDSQADQMQPDSLQPDGPGTDSGVDMPDASTDQTTTDGPSVDGPSVDGPSVDGPSVDGPSVDGPSVDGPSVDGPSVDGPSVDGPSVDGPSVDGPSVDGPSVDGPSVDGPSVDGPSVDGPVADAVVDGPAADAQMVDAFVDVLADSMAVDMTPPTGQLIVTEMMINSQAANDTSGEWIEVHNPTSSAVDMNGWKLMDQGSDSHTISRSLIVQPGGYVVLTRDVASANGGVSSDYAYGPGSDFQLGNSGDEVLLIDASGAVADRVIYTSSWTIPAGASLQLTSPSVTDKNNETSWCPAISTWSGSAGDKGTPGRANVCQGVIITEMLIDSQAVNDASGEWIEVYNPGAAAVDLNGWKLTDQGVDSHTINTSVVVQPGARAVLTRDVFASNGGVTPDYTYGPGNNFSMSNSNDEVVLLNASGVVVDSIVYGRGWTIPAGASLQLSDLAVDRANPANWCEAISPWAGSGGDRGTPGQPNSCGTADGGPSDAGVD
jgi:hypothetical protein